MSPPALQEKKSTITQVKGRTMENIENNEIIDISALSDEELNDIVGGLHVVSNLECI
jgi:hypothetical protein